MTETPDEWKIEETLKISQCMLPQCIFFYMFSSVQPVLLTLVKNAC